VAEDGTRKALPYIPLPILHRVQKRGEIGGGDCAKKALNLVGWSKEDTEKMLIGGRQDNGGEALSKKKGREGAGVPFLLDRLRRKEACASGVCPEKRSAWPSEGGGVARGRKLGGSTKGVDGSPNIHNENYEKEIAQKKSRGPNVWKCLAATGLVKFSAGMPGEEVEGIDSSQGRNENAQRKKICGVAKLQNQEGPLGSSLAGHDQNGGVVGIKWLQTSLEGKNQNKYGEKLVKKTRSEQDKRSAERDFYIRGSGQQGGL